MIVLDEEDQQHIKPSRLSGPTIRLPERAAGRPTGGALPDYETSQALHDSTWISKPTHRRRRLDSNFWKAVLISLFIYTIISLAIGLPFIILKTSTKHSPPPPSPPLSRFTQVNWDDFDLERERNTLFALDDDLLCNAWDNSSDQPGLFTASRKFFIDDNGILIIRSNATGSNMYGNITFSTNPDESESKPLLLLNAHSRKSHLRRGVGICYNPTADERGFDIFVRSLISLFRQLIDSPFSCHFRCRLFRRQRILASIYEYCSQIHLILPSFSTGFRHLCLCSFNGLKISPRLFLSRTSLCKASNLP
jgi:hypothetical protein